MMNTIETVLCTAMLLLGVSGCTSNAESQTDNGIYYWRTTFGVNDYEKKFLEAHNVTKLYVRYFDVDANVDSGTPTPEATIRFNDSIPASVEVVPTVYITQAGIAGMESNVEEYAEKLAKRVAAISRRHGIEYDEVQLDCDWTKSTRTTFDRLCKAVKEKLEPGQTLSATIRLHQLTQAPPPVDKGVLMVYNTGNLMGMTTDNSIFSKKDIAPYLADKRLKKYDLALDVAYPAYGWSVVFKPTEEGYRFNRLMRRTDFDTVEHLKKIGPNTYEATENIYLEAGENPWPSIYKGQRVRTERPDADEILKVKALIEAQLKGKPHRNILYHLDETQLTNYSDNEIDEIFTRG